MVNAHRSRTLSFANNYGSIAACQYLPESIVHAPPLARHKVTIGCPNAPTLLGSLRCNCAIFKAEPPEPPTYIRRRAHCVVLARAACGRARIARRPIGDFVLEIVAGRRGRRLKSLVTDAPRLTLVTCYPFDAVLPGGPLRLVVSAAIRYVPETSRASSETQALQGTRGAAARGCCQTPIRRAQ